MSPQPKKAAADATAGMEELAEQVRQLNERIIEASKKSGETYLQSYQQLLKTVADVQEEAGRSSPWDWVTTIATAQANFTRDIAEAYAAAGRRLQGGE
jgi:TolA-binding protein